MAGRTISTRLSLDGADQFKKNLASINSELKISQAEFKALSASYNSSAKSAEGLSAQQKNLQEQVRLNQERVKGLSSAVEDSAKTYAEAQKELEKIVATHGRESDEAIAAANNLRKAETAMDSYRRQLAGAENDLNKSTAALSKFNEENGKTKIGQAFTAGKAAVEEFKAKIESVKAAVAPVTDELAKVAKAAAEISFKAAEKSAEAFASTVSTGMKEAFSAVETYTKAFAATTTAAFTTAVASVAALSTEIAKSADEVATYGDNVDKMSQKMGLSAEAYQEWDAVMRHSGTTIESLKSGMKTLATAAETGNDAFEKLGLSQEAIASMSQEQLFSATITALQNVQSETERTYLASQLLGKGGTELGALLNTSAEETQRMKDRVHELGGVMSDEAIKNSAKFKDSLQDLQTSISGIKRGIFSNAIPGLTEVMDGLTKVFAGESGGQEQFLKGIDDTINSFSGLEDKVADLAEKLAPLLEKAITGAGKVVGAVLTPMLKRIPSIISAQLPGIGRSALNLLSDLSKQITSALPNFTKNILPKLVSEINKELPKLLSSMTSAFNGIVLNLADAIVQLLPVATKTIIPGMISATTDLISSLVEKLPDLLPNVIDGAVTLFQGLIDGLYDVLDKLIPILPDVVLQLTDALITYAPRFFDSSIEFFEKFIEALSAVTKELLPKLPELITRLCDVLIEHIDDIFNTGFDLLIGLADGLIACIPTLLEKIPQIIKKLVETFTNKENLKNMLEIGIKLISELARGIPQAVGEIVENVPVITKAIVDTIMETDWLQVGKDILEGILSGLLDIDFDAEEFLDEFADNFVTGIKDIFGIHSPSKLMRDEIGKNLALGIGQGFEETMRAETIKMTKAIPTDFDTDVNMRRAEISWSRADIQKAGDVNYYVPVYVTISGDLSENSGRYRRIAEGIAKETQMQLAGMGLK